MGHVRKRKIGALLDKNPDPVGQKTRGRSDAGPIFVALRVGRTNCVKTVAAQDSVAIDPIPEEAAVR